jgi:hypothetical protein
VKPRPLTASSAVGRWFERQVEGSGEFTAFLLKEARASFFAAFLMAAVLLPRGTVLGVPRYVVLMVYALALQAFMLLERMETLDEIRTILVFHALGFVAADPNLDHYFGASADLAQRAKAP